MTATIADGGHLPLEAERQVDREHEEEDDQGPQGLLAHLPTPRRADVVDADVGDVDAGVLRERRGDLALLRAWECLGLDAGTVLVDDDDLRVPEFELPHDVADVARRCRLARRDGELPRRAALEVDPEVEAAAGEQRDQARAEHDPRDERPPPGPAHELVVRALVVEVAQLAPEAHGATSGIVRTSTVRRGAGRHRRQPSAAGEILRGEDLAGNVEARRDADLRAHARPGVGP